MKRHRILGLLTILMAVVAVAGVVSLVSGYGDSVTDGFVLYHAAIAALLVAAGSCLLFAPPLYGYGLSVAAWGFVALDGIWGVITHWEDFWWAWAMNVLFVAIGAAGLAFVIRNAHRWYRESHHRSNAV
jgi:hypothetical protein